MRGRPGGPLVAAGPRPRQMPAEACAESCLDGQLREANTYFTRKGGVTWGSWTSSATGSPFNQVVTKGGMLGLFPGRRGRPEAEPGLAAGKLVGHGRDYRYRHRHNTDRGWPGRADRRARDASYLTAHRRGSRGQPGPRGASRKAEAQRQEGSLRQARQAAEPPLPLHDRRWKATAGVITGHRPGRVAAQGPLGADPHRPGVLHRGGPGPGRALAHPPRPSSAGWQK